MSDSDRPAVVPMSTAQLEGWSTWRLPDVESVADGVWVVPMAIPSGSLPFSFCYVLADGDGVVVVDPGWDSAENLDRLAAFLVAVDRDLSAVTTVVATHHHPDHLGLADRLRAVSGATVLLSRVEVEVLARARSSAVGDLAAHVAALDRWGVPDGRREELLAAAHGPGRVVDRVVPDRELIDRDSVGSGELALRVVATPGHTDGHICLVDDARGLILTGDHVLPGIFPGLGLGTLPGSDPVSAYLDSIERLADFDRYEVLPGHEFRFRGLGARRAELAEHHLRRRAEVAALADGSADASVWAVAEALTWTAGWEGLHGFWLESALRQTEHHLAFVRGSAER